MSISNPTDGMGVFCVRCNAEMEPDAGFCPNCGEPRLLNETVVLPGDPTEVVEEEIIEPAPVVVEDERGIPAWAAALIGVMATLLIVLLVVIFAGRDDDGGTAPTTTVVTAPTTLATVPPPAVQPPPVVVVNPPATSPPATSPPTTNPPTTNPPTTAAP